MAVYKYPVIIEIGKRNCSAYCPDLPGCIATGKTVEETIERMKEAQGRRPYNPETLQRHQTRGV
jgi:hypothetical protein